MNRELLNEKRQGLKSFDYKGIWGKAKDLFKKWKIHARALATHPILYFKNFIKEFEEASLKERVIKVIGLYFTINLCMTLLGLVTGAFIMFAIVGGISSNPVSYDDVWDRFVSEYGREPKSAYELYSKVG